MIQRELRDGKECSAGDKGATPKVFASRTAGRAVFGPRKYFFGFAKRASL
jgi:hypothetical protein